MQITTHQYKVNSILCGIVALSILIRLPFLNVPMISDEGGYAYVAYFWSSDYQLYKDIPFDRPQGIFLLYKFALATFGEGVLSIRLFAAVYSALTTLSVFVVSRSQFSLPSSLISAAVFAIFSTSPSFEGFTANAELFTLLPLTLAAYFAWNRKWFWAGLLSGMASAIKPSGVAGFVLVFVWIAFNGGKPRHFISAGIGFVVIVLASAIHGYIIDWDAYWNSMVDRRLNAFSVATVPVLDQLRKCLVGFSRSFPALGIPLIAALFTFHRRTAKEIVFGWLWFASCWVGMSIGGMWYEHYFQQLLPPVAVLSSQAVEVWREKTDRGVWKVSFAIVASLFMIVDLPRWFNSPDSISWSIYRRPAYVHATEITHFVQNESSPVDSIYVAFSEAQVYYLSKRRVSIPQLYYNEVMHVRGLFEQSVKAVREGKPKVLLISNDPPIGRMTKEDFEDIVATRYKKKITFGSITGWVRVSSYPLTDSE